MYLAASPTVNNAAERSPCSITPTRVCLVAEVGACATGAVGTFTEGGTEGKGGRTGEKAARATDWEEVGAVRLAAGEGLGAVRLATGEGLGAAALATGEGLGATRLAAGGELGTAPLVVGEGSEGLTDREGAGAIRLGTEGLITAGGTPGATGVWGG